MGYAIAKNLSGETKRYDVNTEGWILCEWDELVEIEFISEDKDIKHISCGLNDITKLTIPEGVETICCSDGLVEEINLSSTVKELNCNFNNIKVLELNEGLEEVYCHNNKFNKITLPKSLKEIACSSSLVLNNFRCDIITTFT